MSAGQRLFSKCLAEAIGTFALVFFGCGAVMVGERFPGSVPPDAVPLIFGAVVAAMIYTVGHISGAHFNPAVTFAFTVARHFPVKELVPYWLAQCVGALLAMALLVAILPAGLGFGATVPVTSSGVAFVWEAVLSFFLMFVITAVATDTRAEGMMAGVAIGAIVALAAFVGGPLTGASMNPARSLAPALFAGMLDYWWIYLSAPMLGAGAGALAYQFIRCEAAEDGAGGCC